MVFTEHQNTTLRSPGSMFNYLDQIDGRLAHRIRHLSCSADEEGRSVHLPLCDLTTGSFLQSRHCGHPKVLQSHPKVLQSWEARSRCPRCHHSAQAKQHTSCPGWLSLPQAPTMRIKTVKSSCCTYDCCAYNPPKPPDPLQTATRFPSTLSQLGAHMPPHIQVPHPGFRHPHTPHPHHYYLIGSRHTPIMLHSLRTGDLQACSQTGTSEELCLVLSLPYFRVLSILKSL